MPNSFDDLEARQRETVRALRTLVHEFRRPRASAEIPRVRGSDARFQDTFAALYNDYKMDQGYSPEEIVHKARSLRGVLEPFSMQGNLDLLSRAGFVDIETIFAYVPFAGLLAIK